MQTIHLQIEQDAPGKNPAGGWRVPMSCGRGPRSITDFGEIEISHFSEPWWILANGSRIEPELQISIEQQPGDQT